jgi:hypothetical protein
MSGRKGRAGKTQHGVVHVEPGLSARQPSDALGTGQRQLPVDLHQLQSYPGSVAEDTTIRCAVEERIKIITTQAQSVCRSPTNLLQLFFHYFPHVTTLMENPKGYAKRPVWKIGRIIEDQVPVWTVGLPHQWNIHHELFSAWRGLLRFGHLSPSHGFAWRTP